MTPSSRQARSLWRASDSSGRVATNTSSRPGRSGASRTSSTTKPASTRSAVTASRVRKRRVDSEVIVASANTRVERKVTSSPRTSVASTHDSTRPSPGASATVDDSSRVHSRQASRAGSRVSKTRCPPGTEHVVRRREHRPPRLVGHEHLRHVGRHRHQVEPQVGDGVDLADDPAHPVGAGLGPGHVDGRGRRVDAGDVEAPRGQQHRERARCRSRRRARSAHAARPRWRRTRRGRCGRGRAGRRPPRAGGRRRVGRHLSSLGRSAPRSKLNDRRAARSSKRRDRACEVARACQTR